MGAFVLVLHAESRRYRRAWLALGILVALVGGVALAAVAAGRRTESALPSLVAAHGFDAGVYSYKPWPSSLKVPEVTSVTELLGPFSGQPTCGCPHPINPTDFGVIYEPPTRHTVFKLVSGHLPDPSAPDQVLASFTLQEDEGVHLGSVIVVPFYSPSQAAAYNNATGAPPKPNGPVVTFHVVGFEATEYEFPSGTTPSYDLYTTPAFANTLLRRTAFGYVYAVRLRHGAADLGQFNSQVSAVGAEAFNEDTEVLSVEASVHPQAIGWWILAALAAIVGLAVLGQALVRQSSIESGDYPTMAALGADRRQLLALGLGRNLVVGLGGAVGALIVATALSPIAPLGEARAAEAYTGVAFDPPALLFGVLATVVFVFVLGLWPTFRAARALPSDDRAEVPRPSLLLSRLVALGAPPSAVIGVRNAFERRGGQGTVAVGSALLGTIFAVAALCGTAVFGASLSHLTGTPRLYGDTFQLNVTDPSGTPDDALLRSLEHNRAVAAITRGYAVDVSINKISVGAVAGSPIRGAVLLSSIDGPVPMGDGQIGLGVTTMHQLGAHLGSIVDVMVATPSGGERTVPFRVVSRISFPVLGGVVGLGRGAAFTIAGYENAVCPAGHNRPVCLRALQSASAGGGLLVSVVPGLQGQAAVNYYLRTYSSITALPVTPTSLVNFGEAVNFPLIFGGMLAVSGAATLVHLLVLSVARRRREMGLLKALGFVNRQIVASVAWQATALVGVGIIVGVPLGIVLGREVWSVFANNLGVVPVSVVDPWLLVAIVLGVLAAANLLAIAPAFAARRSKPQQLLRAQ